MLGRLLTQVSPQLWRHVPDPGGMRSDIIERIGQMHARLRGRACKAGQPFAPLGGGTDGARNKSSTAVWADVMNFVVNAVVAKGAVEAANPRMYRVGR